MDCIEVLVVEDDPMVAEIHQNFINSVAGFRVAAVADNGIKALEFLKCHSVRLVILDIFLPGLDGMGLLERIRASRSNVDVIVVSASRDTNTVNRALQAGAFDYIVKPFLFERLRSSLQSFQQVLNRVDAGPRQIGQQEIDSLLQARSHKNAAPGLPKGLNPCVLARLKDLMAAQGRPLSSVEAAELLKVSRITARRYLEYLVAEGKAHMERQYREVGRPVNKYSLKKNALEEP